MKNAGRVPATPGPSPSRGAINEAVETETVPGNVTDDHGLTGQHGCVRHVLEPCGRDRNRSTTGDNDLPGIGPPKAGNRQLGEEHILIEGDVDFFDAINAIEIVGDIAAPARIDPEAAER